MPEIIDIAIIGSGPAGLCAAEAAQAVGLRARVFEKGCLAENIWRFPTFMQFHSTGENLELGGLPLICRGEKPTRQEYLEYLRRYVEAKKIDVHLYTEVLGVSGARGGFTVRLRDRHGAEREERARFVVIGTGGYATPQRLGVPGDGLPKVKHFFDEPHPYWNEDVLVVGGKNSAVEIALTLWRAHARVTIVHRRADFARVKYWLRPDIENRIQEGAIQGLLPAEVVRIEPRTVNVRMTETGEERTLANDWVFAMTGFQPNREFLGRCGVEIDEATRQPVVDPMTLESNVPGIFCAGVIVGGNISGMIFIENARYHGQVVVERIVELSR